MDRLPVGVRIAVVGLVALVAVIYLSFGLLTARETLGCDFLVYREAALDLFAGRPIYDLSITTTGECNLYYYPPPFVAVAAPFALLPEVAGILAWIVLLTACYVAGCAAIPVRAEVKLAVFMIGAVSWPFIFGVRIGQVVPILFLLFALGWRWLGRSELVGATAALGALVKLQPAVVVGWLAARRDWRGIAAAVVVGLAISAVAALFGLGGWFDMAMVLGNLESAIDHPVNFSIGATGYQLGFSAAAAALLQTLATVGVLSLVVVWAIRGTADSSYLVAVVASQVVSPIVWSHYALILLLPVAWLLERRHWWAAVVPLSQAWVLLPFAPNQIYVVGWYLILFALPVVDWTSRRAAASMEPVRA